MILRVESYAGELPFAGETGVHLERKAGRPIEHANQLMGHSWFLKKLHVHSDTLGRNLRESDRSQTALFVDSSQGFSPRAYPPTVC